MCADVTDPSQPGGMCKGQRSDSERPLSPEGSSQASPLPPSARLPRRLCMGAAARAAAGSHGVPDPENKHAHTAWGLGVFPELKDKSIKSLWAQRCPWPPHPASPGWRGVGGAASPAGNPGSRGCSRCSFMRIRRVQGGVRKRPLWKAHAHPSCGAIDTGAGDTALRPRASVHIQVAGTRCRRRKGRFREQEVRRYLQSVRQLPSAAPPKAWRNRPPVTPGMQKSTSSQRPLRMVCRKGYTTSGPKTARCRR